MAPSARCPKLERHAARLGRSSRVFGPARWSGHIRGLLWGFDPRPRVASPYAPLALDPSRISH
eukprot:7216721-Pyramimonas_sp.AAC.1